MTPDTLVERIKEALVDAENYMGSCAILQAIHDAIYEDAKRLNDEGMYMRASYMWSGAEALRTRIDEMYAEISGMRSK